MRLLKNKLKLPSRLGEIALVVDGTRILVCNNKGIVQFVIRPPVVRDKEDSGNKGFDLPTDVITRGESWHKYLGTGTSITRTYTGHDRTIIQTITLTADALKIECKTTFGADKDTVKDGFDMEVRIQSDKWLTDKDTIAPYVNFMLGCYTDDGELNSNFVYTAEATEAWSNYQSRANATERNARIQIPLGNTPVLHKMNQPEGRNATLIFTDHADGTCLESMKAVFYGASDEGHSNYGVKGFASRGLKTTWSVFYVTVTANTGIDNADFVALCEAIQATGTEIIPHRTRATSDNTRADMEAHLPVYDTKFNSRNWIDHGLAAGYRNAGLKSLGWDSASEFHIMDLLQTYGYEYAWSYLDAAERSLYGLDMLTGDFIGIPKHLIYQNTNLKLPNGVPLWQWWSWRSAANTLFNRLTESNIDLLINRFGLSLNHEYFGHQTLHDGYFFQSGTPWVITDAFDNILSYIADKQTAGDLWVPTLSEWGDYFRQIAQVDIEITGTKTYKLINNSGGIITSFSVRSPGVYTATLDGVNVVNSKTASGNTVFWFDLAAGEHILILN